jgi:hypothetical protein
MTVALLIGLPLIVIAHRFSANSGYRYMNYAAAMREALLVGTMVAIFEIIGVGGHLILTGAPLPTEHHDPSRSQ